MSKYTPAVETGLDRMREMARGNFDLKWMDSNPAGWGHKATPGPAGLRLCDVETGHYAHADGKVACDFMGPGAFLSPSPLDLQAQR